VEHSQHDWERQRDQLSALLDNELDEQERAALTAHLPTCAECRAELESLRRTRALVRALPQPALPRSFALPLEAAPVQELPRPAAAASPARRHPSAPPARLSNRRRPLRTLQWISTIAAVLGIALLLSSFLSGLSFGGRATSASYTNAPAAAGTGQQSSTPAPTSRTTDTHTGESTPSVPTTKPPGATPTPSPTTSERKLGGPGSASGAPSNPFLGALISTTGLGALLLILSACGFTIAWAMRRRYRLNR
jgi:negative regulator of sigma E activity